MEYKKYVLDDGRIVKVYKCPECAEYTKYIDVAQGEDTYYLVVYKDGFYTGSHSDNRQNFTESMGEVATRNMLAEIEGRMLSKEE